MGFFDQLKQKTQDMSSQLQLETKKFNNRDFAKASMAMCALIAAADAASTPRSDRRPPG